MLLQRPKGTRDILPQEIYKWQYVEDTIKEIFENAGMKEIRVPVFEYTELFQRGVGETTDVVQKEMYTFNDKGDRSITLRPEGTAGVVRSYIENGLSNVPRPLKLWYNMPMYRYENVQKGRYREFRQIGLEVIGTSSYLADIEVILISKEIFNKLEIPNVSLNINNIGCPECRKKYQEALREFLRPNYERYCDTCKTRFEKNPMRILDCKEEKCKKMNEGAPTILEYLCKDCKEHFENVKRTLKKLNIDYKIDAGIVRGLDYYTKTVFEFVSDDDGFTVLGGGRYDGLIKEVGGQDTPAIGFATGIDRLIDVYDKYNSGKVLPKRAKLYIASIGEAADVYATQLTMSLRNKGIYVEKDICSRGLNAQFKYANKINSEYVLTIGDEELNKKIANIKNMETGYQEKITLDIDKLVSYLS